MKNKRLIIAGTFAALTIGGLSAGSIASAQSYDGSDDASSQTTEAPAPSFGTDPGRNDLRPVQDVEGENPDAPPEGRRGHRGGCNMEEAAAAIGIDQAELREALDSGQSIADVAEANGVAVQEVIDAMVEAETEHISEKVAEGRLTQEEADEKLAELETRITDRVNGAVENHEGVENQEGEGS